MFASSWPTYLVLSDVFEDAKKSTEPHRPTSAVGKARPPELMWPIRRHQRTLWPPRMSATRSLRLEARRAIQGRLSAGSEAVKIIPTRRPGGSGTHRARLRLGAAKDRIREPVGRPHLRNPILDLTDLRIAVRQNFLNVAQGSRCQLPNSLPRPFYDGDRPDHRGCNHARSDQKIRIAIRIQRPSLLSSPLIAA